MAANSCRCTCCQCLAGLGAKVQTRLIHVVDIVHGVLALHDDLGNSISGCRNAGLISCPRLTMRPVRLDVEAGLEVAKPAVGGLEPFNIQKDRQVLGLLCQNRIRECAILG